MVQVDFMAQEKPGKKSYILSSTANYMKMEYEALFAH